MSSKSIEKLTKEQRKLHEEFTNCQNWGEVENFLKKVEKLNESKENNKLPFRSSLRFRWQYPENFFRNFPYRSI